MMKQLTVLLSLCLMLSCSSPPKLNIENLTDEKYPEIQVYLSDFIKQHMTANKVTGLSIALVDGQKVIWSEGFGYADKENDIAASNQTQYRAGSVSKLFTATAIMQLHEQDLIDIDQPLQATIPEFQIKSRFSNSEPISLRHILSHHSGLPGDLIDGMWSQNLKPLNSILESLAKSYVAYPPNKLMSYSNQGYSLAGISVERASGQNYSEYMQEHMLAPLGMAQSKFHTRLNGEFASKTYIKGKPVEELPLRDVPAGGLNTSALELAKLIKMVIAQGQFQEHQIIQPSTLEEMLKPQNTDVVLDLGNPIGLGWMDYSFLLGNTFPLIGHYGGTLAHRASLVIAPEQQLGVVILANSPLDQNHITREILRIALAVKTGKAIHNEDKQNLMETEIQDWVGTYASEMGLIRVSGKPGRYQATALGSTFALKHEEKNWYLLSYKLFGWIPLGGFGSLPIQVSRTRIDGHDLIIGNHKGRHFLLGTKIKTTDRVDSWDQRIGQFDLLNPPEPKQFSVENIKLRWDQGHYLFEYTFAGKKIIFPIEPLTDKEAIISGLGRGLGESILVSEINGQEILNFQGLMLARRN